MATRLVPENTQEMTVFVNGPEDANRLTLCSGDVGLALVVGGNINQQNMTFSFVVGPPLQRKQFVRAIATVALSRQSLSLTTGNAQAPGVLTAAWDVISADADWDDETGQVEVRVEVQAMGAPGLFAQLNGIAYNVSILAALPA